jgi:hypothetical protein
MTPWIVVPLVALGVAYVLLPVAIEAFVRYRRKKAVRWPLTWMPADVLIDARRAALSAVVGSPSLQIEDCSLWPERTQCGRQCLELTV